MNKGYGLVLNGGGAKGAYQIGAWAALRQLELYDEITAVSGTSVGALNALLISQDDFDKAINVWKTIKQEDITPFGSKNSGTENILYISRKAMEKIDTLGVDPNGFANAVAKILPLGKDIVKSRMTDIYKVVFDTKGFCSQEGLENILRENINLESLRAGRTVYACASKISENELFTPYYFMLNKEEKEKIIEIALASSAIYPVYGTKKINGELYLDGGFSDNVPIQPLYDIGYRKFIIIYLTNRKIPDKSKYKDCKFIEVIPDETMKDDMYTVINFERTVLDKYMEKGYHDTMVEFISRGFKRK